MKPILSRIKKFFKRKVDKCAPVVGTVDENGRVFFEFNNGEKKSFDTVGDFAQFYMDYGQFFKKEGRN